MPGTIFDQLDDKKANPTTPVPVRSGKTGTIFDALDEKGTQGQPSVKETGQQGVAEAARQGKSLFDASVEHAPEIGSMIGGIAGTAVGSPVIGAGVGGALGQGAKDLIQNPEMDTTGRLLRAGGSGATSALMQYASPLLIQGVSKLGAAGIRAGIKATQGAAPEALAVVPKPGLPALPQAPPSMAQIAVDKATKAGQEATVAASAAVTAQAESQAAQGAQDATAKAINESLDLLPHEGTFGTGQEVQSGLRTGSDIWHREGGLLYDQSKALTNDLQIPVKQLQEIGSKLHMEKQAETLAFAQSGGYTPKIQKIVDDITSLGMAITDKDGNILRPASDTVPFQALDGYRQTLQALSQDHTDPLAATQAQGILKKFTGAITEVMSKDLAGTPEGAAWEGARKFWKEGAEVFDHAVMTKAVNANPEDVLAMIKPANGIGAASITAAQQFRSGLIDYVKKNGTPEEITRATTVYNKLLHNFTERNLGINSNVAELPNKLAGYKDLMSTLYDGTAEGKTLKQSIYQMSDAISDVLRKNNLSEAASALATKTQKTATSLGKTAGKFESAEFEEFRKAALSAGKSVEDARSQAEQQVVARAQKRVKTGLATIAAAVGITGHSIAATEALVGMNSADWLVQRTLKSPEAADMLAKWTAKQLERNLHPPNISTLNIRPGDGLIPGDATWITNFAKALNATNEVKKEVEPFGPIPVRVK